MKQTDKKTKEFSFLLFDRDLTRQFYFLLQTLEEACGLLSDKYKNINKDKEFDKIAALEVIMLKNLSQYIEALIAYCLACQKDNSRDFIDSILKYNGGQIHNFIKKIERLSDNELNNILSFCGSLHWVSDQNKDQIEKKMEKSRNNLRGMLLQLKSFWNTYHDFYNASKHGGRWWMTDIKQKGGEDRYIGIQWLRKDGDINSELKEEKELIDVILERAEECKKIMGVLFHNRKLLWTSNSLINQDKYLYFD